MTNYKEPLKMEFFQGDLEKIQFFLREAITITGQHNPEVATNLQCIKDDFQRKIIEHIVRNDWK